MQDCLIYVSSSFSTQTSYENQTKKAITNKFIHEAMTDFLKHQLEVYFIEKPDEAPENLPSRCWSTSRAGSMRRKPAQSLKKTLTGNMDIANRVQKFVDCRTKDVSRRELYIVEGDSALGACQDQPGLRVSRPSCPCGARSSTA